MGERCTSGRLNGDPSSRRAHGAPIRNRLLLCSVHEGCGEVGQKARRCVASVDGDFDRRELPVNAQRRIVPAERALGLGLVIVGHFIERLAVVVQGAVGMSKTFGDQQLVVVARREFRANPMSERRLTAPDIDRDIEDRAAYAAHQFVLCIRRLLEVQASHNAALGRARVIVL